MPPITPPARAPVPVDPDSLGKADAEAEILALETVFVARALGLEDVATREVGACSRLNKIRLLNYKARHTGDEDDGRTLAGVVDLTGTGELVLAGGTITAGEVVGRTGTETRTTEAVVVAVGATRTSVVVGGAIGLGVVVVTGRGTGASSPGTIPSPGIRPVLCLATISFNLRPSRIECLCRVI